MWQPTFNVGDRVRMLRDLRLRDSTLVRGMVLRVLALEPDPLGAVLVLGELGTNRVMARLADLDTHFIEPYVDWWLKTAAT